MNLIKAEDITKDIDTVEEADMQHVIEANRYVNDYFRKYIKSIKYSIQKTNKYTKIFLSNRLGLINVAEVKEFIHTWRDLGYLVNIDKAANASHYYIQITIAKGDEQHR